MEDGKVKFTFDNELINDHDIMEYVKEGKLTTDRYPIESVDNAVFRKLRNGPVRRSSGDTEPRKRGKDGRK